MAKSIPYTTFCVLNTNTNIFFGRTSRMVGEYSKPLQAQPCTAWPVTSYDLSVEDPERAWQQVQYTSISHQFIVCSRTKTPRSNMNKTRLDQALEVLNPDPHHLEFHPNDSHPGEAVC